jgi:hypothetical protein
MQMHRDMALVLAKDLRQRDIEQAANERRLPSSRSSIRRSVGHRVIAIGQRIAAEPHLELARSR